MVGCTPKSNNEASNIALVEKYIESVENLDSKGMGNFLSDDYMGYGPSHNNEINKEDVINNCH